MGRGARKGPAFWSEHVEQYRRGAMSLREYCERHDLKLSTFGRWRRRLCRNPSSAPVSAIPPVNVVRVDVDAVATPRGAPLEVELGNGRIIRVGSDFDAPTLARVVTTLEQLS